MLIILKCRGWGVARFCDKTRKKLAFDILLKMKSFKTSIKFRFLRYASPTYSPRNQYYAIHKSIYLYHDTLSLAQNYANYYIFIIFGSIMCSDYIRFRRGIQPPKNTNFKITFIVCQLTLKPYTPTHTEMHKHRHKQISN